MGNKLLSTAYTYSLIKEVVEKNNSSIDKFLLSYATEQKIIIDLNKQYLFRGRSLSCSPIMFAIINNNDEIVKYILDYASALKIRRFE